MRRIEVLYYRFDLRRNCRPIELKKVFFVLTKKIKTKTILQTDRQTDRKTEFNSEPQTETPKVDL